MFLGVCEFIYCMNRPNLSVFLDSPLWHHHWLLKPCHSSPWAQLSCKVPPEGRKRVKAARAKTPGKLVCDLRPSDLVARSQSRTLFICLGFATLRPSDLVARSLSRISHFYEDLRPSDLATQRPQVARSQGRKVAPGPCLCDPRPSDSAVQFCINAARFHH